MNIIPKLTVALSLMVGAIMATSCADDIETGINPDPTGNAISFAPAVGHSTRATETTISNLGDFAVVARGMHPDGVLYDNYLIGSPSSVEIAHYESYDNPDTPTKGTWILDRQVYWPSSLEKVLFFAYTTLKNDDSYTGTDVFGNTNTKFGFNGDNPYIKNFQPEKADLNTTPANGIWADGMVQKDLLAAFTQQLRSTSPTYVGINFEHVLTQVTIKAYRGNPAPTDHRIVKIKGAWIYNASEGGDLTSTLTKGSVATDEVDITKGWKTDDYSKTGYGSFYQDIIPLDDSSKPLLRNNYSMMLIPENQNGWNKKDGTDSNDGAFILLLCRVELEHEGATHSGSDSSMGDIAIHDGKHYHQMFPVNADDKYVGEEYGFVCVPLKTDWNTNGMGKHYTYNLDICGYGTGAGWYPPAKDSKGNAIDYTKLVPENTEVKVFDEYKTLKLTTAIPSGKKVGDPVLDEPIKFTVTVTDWPQEKDWTVGNIDL